MGSNFCGCNNNPSQNTETNQVNNIYNNLPFFNHSFQIIKTSAKIITHN